jgi:hypothetical protein
MSAEKLRERMMKKMKAIRYSLRGNGYVIRVSYLSLGVTYQAASTVEILSAPGTNTEKAQPAPFLISKTACAVLRVVTNTSP